MTRSWCAAAALLGVVAMSSSARAEDTSDLEGLLDEGIVSTASKSAETASASPATTSSISSEDLFRYGIRSLDEAINFLTMGMVVSDRTHNKELSARGVMFTTDYGDHVLLLINGHAVNDQWGGAAYFDRGAGIPLELVDHIEVILGPGSVLYGSNAMLGVVNVVTKRAKDFEGLHAVVESEVPISLRGAVGFGHEFKLFGLKSEVAGEVEYYAQKGPVFRYALESAGRDPITKQPYRTSLGGANDGFWGGLAEHSNDAQLPSGYVRAFVGPVEIDLRAVQWKRSDPDEYVWGAFDDPGSYELEHWFSFDVKHKAVLSKQLDLSSRLYGDSYDYRDRLEIPAPSGCAGGVGRVAGCTYDLVGTARWVGLEEQLDVDWLRDGTFVTVGGFDGRLRWVDSQADYADRKTGFDPGPFGAFSVFEPQLGAYVQQTARPVRWLGLNAGVRLDLGPDGSAHGSPRIALAVDPWKGGTVKAIYSEAFRAPNAYERFYEDPTSQLAAPELRPEVVRSIEGSVEHKFSSQRIFAGVFRSWWNDMIESVPLTAAELAAAQASGDITQGTRYAEQYQNTSIVESYGFDAGYDGSALKNRLRFGASFTGARARQQFGAGEPFLPMNVAPQTFGNARVAFDLGGGWPTLAVAARYVGERPGSGAYQGAYVPEPYAPPLVEVRGTVSGRLSVHKALGYRFTVDGTTTSRGPYTVGPTALPNGSAELGPVDTFRAGVGLWYDLPL